MESKYTKAERREIYLKAARRIKYRWDDYACHALDNASSFNLITSSRRVAFPEFYLFEPKRGQYVWWPSESGTEGQLRKQRVIALLLCAEMCNDN